MQVSLDGIVVQLRHEPSRLVRSIKRLLSSDSIVLETVSGVAGGFAGIALNVLLFTLVYTSSQVIVLQQGLSLIYLLVSLFIVISLINAGMAFPDALHGVLKRSSLQKVSSLHVGPHEVRITQGRKTHRVPLSSLQALDEAASEAVPGAGVRAPLVQGCSPASEQWLGALLRALYAPGEAGAAVDIPQALRALQEHSAR